ncbi:MAG: DUF805 domain-containing protein [Pseudomonadota bacterium]|nr:DUF805 domain-containing protein [Pseudomonadota bacterium]
MRQLSPLEWALRPLKRYADFKGRAPRAEYWWFYLATLIVDRVLSFIDKQAGTDDSLSSIFALAIVVPWIAVTVRRLHDSDRTGWWLLIFVVPLAGFTAFAVQAGYAGGGAVEDSPVPFFGLVALTVVAGITLFVFMVLDGTAGPNRYGADPYGPDQLEEIFA